VSLPAALTLVYHASEPHPREVPLAAVYDPLDVPLPAGRPAVILNMVQTLDGAVAIDGRAWELGSAVDHYLFRTLRGWADAVLNGAGTLRRNDVVATTHEHLQARRREAGRTANPVAIVVSRRAGFPDDVLRKRFFTDRRFRSVVLATEAIDAADRRRVEDAGAEVWIASATPAGDVDVRAALVAIRAQGITRLLAEGGPRTNQQLVEARAIDELFVTVTPAVAGVPAPGRLAGIFGGAWAGLQPISEYQYRAPALREWYWRFAVGPAGVAC
jgi:riboflavin biosynthesis pyrimidine reductase